MEKKKEMSIGIERVWGGGGVGEGEGGKKGRGVVEGGFTRCRDEIVGRFGRLTTTWESVHLGRQCAIGRHPGGACRHPP